MNKKNRTYTKEFKLEALELLRTIGDSQLFRHYVEQATSICPELFPAAFAAVYWCHDVKHSKKMPDAPLRRIKLPPTGEVYTIVPSFVLTYRMIQ